MVAVKQYLRSKNKKKQPAPDWGNLGWQIKGKRLHVKKVSASLNCQWPSTGGVGAEELCHFKVRAIYIHLSSIPWFKNTILVRHCEVMQLFNIKSCMRRNNVCAPEKHQNQQTLGTMNECSTFHDNLSSSCQNIFVWTNFVFLERYQMSEVENKTKGTKKENAARGEKKKKVQEVVQMWDRCNQNSSKMSSRVLIWVLSWQSCSIWVRDYYISLEVGGGRYSFFLYCTYSSICPCLPPLPRFHCSKLAAISEQMPPPHPALDNLMCVKTQETPIH